MIVSFILCSFRSIFDNFVLSHKQNPLFCRLCKLKSGISYRLILFYDYFEHFAMFIYFLKPFIQAKGREESCPRGPDSSLLLFHKSVFLRSANECALSCLPSLSG